VKSIFQLIDYNKYQWQISGDLKIIGIIIGMQKGNVGHPCFLCKWNSRTKTPWDNQVCPPRTDWAINKQLNVEKEPLIPFPFEKILLPPLHIKLGLMAQFVKKLAKRPDNAAYNYIRVKFPKVTQAKCENGIFVGPQIRKMMNDPCFEPTLAPDELQVWSAFRQVICGFLGNNKSPNYVEDVGRLMNAMRDMDLRMSPKVHYLNAHLDRFPENVGRMSEEQGERFHQEIKQMEERYFGKASSNILSDYCWTLIRETDFVTNPTRCFRPFGSMD
jgi:hypothetical protein